MRDDQLYDAVVGLTYEAALKPALYHGVMELLRSGLGGAYVGLSILGHKGGYSFPYAVGLSGEDLQSYGDYYIGVDPTIEPSLRAPQGTCLPVPGFIDLEVMRRSESYNDFFAPRSLRVGMGAVLYNDSAVFSTIVLWFGERSDATLPEEVRFMRRLLPHFQRSVRLHHLFVQEHTRALAADDALDALALAVMVLDGEARVLRTNRRADALLRRSGSLDTARGVLSADNPSVTSALQAFLRAIVRREDTADPYFCVPRTRKPPLIVSAIPTTPSSSLWLQVPGTVVIFVHDPLDDRVTPIDLLVRAYGLTPAEARLASALGEGLSLEEYADDMRITKHTARTQLKRVLSKTGARRQAELVKLVAALVPPVP